MTRCDGCARELVTKRKWLRLSTDDRAAAHAAGRTRAATSRACTACHKARVKARQHPAPTGAAVIDPARACARCGISGVVAHLDLCTDCADVTTDLRETTRWVAPADPVPA